MYRTLYKKTLAMYKFNKILSQWVMTTVWIIQTKRNHTKKNEYEENNISNKDNKHTLNETVLFLLILHI